MNIQIIFKNIYIENNAPSEFFKKLRLINEFASNFSPVTGFIPNFFKYRRICL